MLMPPVSRSDAELRFRQVQLPPARGVVELAHELDADLVVVGSHGRRGVRRWILGSVAEVAARHAPCSTLIVRSAAA
jgi:nucleotide-binding universal stress UspA family protein